MTETDEPTFTAEEAMRAQTLLRGTLGLGAERFPLPAFVGMLSDEIEQLRHAGKSDRDIAAMIETATGKRIAAEAIATFYATPEARGGR